jgi:hypothetical protein
MQLGSQLEAGHAKPAIAPLSRWPTITYIYFDGLETLSPDSSLIMKALSDRIADYLVG